MGFSLGGQIGLEQGPKERPVVRDSGSSRPHRLPLLRQGTEFDYREAVGEIGAGCRM
jgi:hypothetical protein